MISAVQTAISGVATASAQFDRAAQTIASSGSSSTPTDTVDLSSAALDIIGAGFSVQLNVAMLKMANKADAHLLDILA